MMGSVEERANYKQTLLPYVIGCVIIFTAATIVQGIYGFVGSVKEEISNNSVEDENN